MKNNPGDAKTEQDCKKGKGNCFSEKKAKELLGAGNLKGFNVINKTLPAIGILEGLGLPYTSKSEKGTNSLGTKPKILPKRLLKSIKTKIK